MASPTPAPAASPASVWANLPIRLYANVNLRQDFQRLQDKADLLLEGNEVDGLLTRIRFGLEYKNTDSAVTGGVRVSVGEVPNPASPFTRMGDAFRPVTFGLDQFYVDVRPFKKHRDRFSLSLGKMPQPFWRGDKGTTRSEFHWDDDISPVGGVFHLNFYRSDDDHHSVSVDNVGGYFIVEWFRQNRFEGFRGDTSLYADQLVVKVKRFTVAGTYYFWDNLNSGARSPSFTPNVGAFVSPGTSAFLLRPGPQVTNARLNVGGTAFTFRKNEFHILDGLAQASVPVGLPWLGKSELFALGEISHNFSVPFENDGWGVTVGLTGGSYARRVHPWTLWWTWRRVEMDAALGTFADSDLGPGTDVKGFEISADYHITRNFYPYVSYFNAVNAPFRSTDLERLFFGLNWDF